MNTTLLEAACLLTAKLSGVEKLYDEQTLEAAERRFRGGIGLQELLLEAAWANGYSGRNFRDSRAVLRSAFANQIVAGFSSVDIGGDPVELSRTSSCWKASSRSNAPGGTSAPSATSATSRRSPVIG